MEKIFDAIRAFFSFLGKLPGIGIIKKLKGYRTIILNTISVFLVILDGFDVIGFLNLLCEIINFFVGLVGGDFVCSVAGAAAVWTIILNFLNSLLRIDTDTSVGKKSN